LDAFEKLLHLTAFLVLDYALVIFVLSVQLTYIGRCGISIPVIEQKEGPITYE
jgi:hypothetical protein